MTGSVDIDLKRFPEGARELLCDLMNQMLVKKYPNFQDESSFLQHVYSEYGDLEKTKTLVHDAVEGLKAGGHAVVGDDGVLRLTKKGEDCLFLKKLTHIAKTDKVVFLDLVKTGDFTSHWKMLLQKFDEHSGRMKDYINAHKDIYDDKHLRKFNAVEFDSLRVSDSNFFNTVYSAIISHSNLTKNLVKLDDGAERPADTIASVIRLMLSDKLKIFHCSDVVSTMLLDTNNLVFTRKLPFGVMFVDMDFKYGKNYEFWGMFLATTKKLADGGMAFFDSTELNDSFFILAMGWDKRCGMIQFVFSIVDEKGLCNPSKYKGMMKFVAVLACNFLDFLHDPNVKYMKASESSGRSHKLLRARYERLKIDLDKTYFVKIEDPLRRYVDQYVRMRTKKGYSHRFHVRGHFRTLRADRYGENVGKRIWIAPYIKGQGVLIVKHYDIDKREDGSHEA